MTSSILGRLSLISIKTILILNFISILSYSFVKSWKQTRRVQNRAFSFRSKLPTFRSVLDGGSSESSYETVNVLKELCLQFVTKSTVSSSASGLTDTALLERITQSLNETCFLTASTFGSFLLSSPFPANSVIFEGDNYALHLLTVPRGKEVFLSESSDGTVLYYKPLMGSGDLQTVQELRKIDSIAMIGSDNFNTHKSDVIRKDGGVIRKFSCHESSPSSSVLLELAFWRGRSSDTVGVGSAVTDDRDPSQTLTLIQPPLFELNGLFESALENGRRNEEIMRRNALFSANAKKYDILERIRFRVGGLSSELADLVRRVLSSRQISSSILSKLGISHIKGILLYGPPGTGKTLIAREMAKALNSREPILINGPEIMDKYVGEAERNIRDLFKPAEEEWATRGAESELHVIIFDEFDSVAKKRGSLSGDGSGVRDSCVNQLLSKLDGVEEMNNVLVICLTNRKDLIDSALLRPGRLEVHIEIKPPTIEGREEILYILFKPMVLGGYVSFEDAKKWSRTLAERTFGYTGADLTGLLRNAASFAIERSLSQIQSENRYQQKSDLSPEEQKIEKTKNKLSLEKSIFLLWDDIETAYLESSKELKISKRAKVNDFLRRNIFSKKQSKKDEEKVVRREFEDILNSVDFEAEELINVEEENEENDLPDNDAFIVKPAFQNLGGTLIF